MATASQSSPKAILPLMFTPNSMRLLSSNEHDLLTVWDVESGQCLKTTPVTGETSWQGSVTFSVNGSLLATAGHTQMIKVWDASNGELRHTLSCQGSQPGPVALSTDQRLLACGTNEGTILFWELTS